MLHATIRRCAGLVAASLLVVGCTSINTALITGDNQTVLAIDLDTDTVIGAVTLPAAAGISGGLKTPVLVMRGTRAFVPGGDDRTYLLKVRASALELGTEAPFPARLPDGGEVLDHAAANPWTLVRSNPPGVGFALGANNTLDVRTVASSAPMDYFDQAVVCDDGATVLVRDYSERRVSWFNLDRAGILTDTGHALRFDTNVHWVACAPGATAGAVILAGSIPEPEAVVSFRIATDAGLVIADRVVAYAHASGTGGKTNAIAFAADATGIFVRSSLFGAVQDGRLERFSFDPVSAAIGASADFSVRSGVSYRQGSHEIGVNPAGGRVYAPDEAFPDGRVDIFDALTGAVLGRITHPDMPNPVEFIVTR